MLDPAAPKHMLFRLKQWKAHKNTPPKYFEHLCLMEFVLQELIEENNTLRAQWLQKHGQILDLVADIQHLQITLARNTDEQKTLIDVIIKLQNGSKTTKNA